MKPHLAYIATFAILAAVYVAALSIGILIANTGL
jgi:hypothetical protein